MDKILSFHKLYYRWWKNIDKFILTLIILLFLVGLFFSLVSTSLVASDRLNTNDYLFFFKHLVFLIIGVFFIFIFSSIDQENLLNISKILFVASIILLLLVPLIGIEVKGSKRWIDLYLLPRFQPIELVKPFLIVFLSVILSNKKFGNIYLRYLISFIVTLLIVFLLALQPDIGQTLLTLFSWSVLIFISGISFIFLIGLIFILISSFSYLILFVSKFSYIKSRIFSFFDTETGTHNFQSDKALESIISGGFFGKGLGEGTLKNRVPEAHTDYIISVISEEFGIIAIILILFLFLVFIHTVFKKVNLENDDISKLILVGCISLILMQVMIHVGVNIRLLPTTGMTLPFISYGGSSIVGMSIISGIILNLTKRKIN